MCTCIEIKNDGKHKIEGDISLYFGRNLDLEYRFGEKVIITPRNYLFKLKNGEEFKTKYGMIGMATNVAGYPLYAEASNEKGLSIAGLYFPGSAKFFDDKDEKLNLAPYELIPYFLGNFSSIEEMRKEIDRLNIVNKPFMEGMPVADLHWMISDEKECIVLEQKEDGLHVYNNDIGVLTNNPDFSFQRQNLANYLNLNTSRGENTFAKGIDLKTYGQGMAAIGLPGDFSPVSRFVKVSFTKLNTHCTNDEDSVVSQFFHVLDSVAMTKGSVVTQEGLDDLTTYSCCYSAKTKTYYYKTYTNNQITAVKMKEENLEKETLSIFDLDEKQKYNFAN